MLNEVEHIESGKNAAAWVAGCAAAALRERLTYEVGRALMSRKAMKLSLGIAAALAIVAIAMFMQLKPYQRDRIWISLGYAASASNHKSSPTN